MQTQQQKTLKQNSFPKQSFHVGEVMVAVLNLLIGMVVTMSTWTVLVNVIDAPKDAFGGYLATIATFGALGVSLLLFLFSALGASLLIFLRQRRLAASAQWLGIFGLIFLVGSAIWVSFKLRFWIPLTLGNSHNLLFLFFSASLFAWFAWFLKRIDDSE